MRLTIYLTKGELALMKDLVYEETQKGSVTALKVYNRIKEAEESGPRPKHRHKG